MKIIPPPHPLNNRANRGPRRVALILLSQRYLTVRPRATYCKGYYSPKVSLVREEGPSEVSFSSDVVVYHGRGVLCGVEYFEEGECERESHRTRRAVFQCDDRVRTPSLNLPLTGFHGYRAKRINPPPRIPHPFGCSAKPRSEKSS